MTILAAAVLGFFTMTAQTDTTLAVRPGTRLEVSNFGGAVSVSTWEKNAVRIEADHSSRTTVSVETSESGLRVSTSGRRGPPGSVEFRITVPAWMAVTVSGPFNDVSVAGTRGDVKVETVRGDVKVEGGVGYISLSTVQGLVNLARAKGRIRLSSINEGITASDIAGDIQAETVNGDVVLERVHSDAVEASSVSGDLSFSGVLGNPGHYHLETHSGDIDVMLPEKPNASVSVATFNGDFNSDFQVFLKEVGRGARRYQFMLGTGGPQLDLETFNGSIRLRKAVEGIEQRMQLRERRKAGRYEKLIERVKLKAREKQKENGKDKEKDEEER